MQAYSLLFWWVGHGSTEVPLPLNDNLELLSITKGYCSMCTCSYFQAQSSEIFAVGILHISSLSLSLSSLQQYQKRVFLAAMKQHLLLDTAQTMLTIGTSQKKC